MGVTNPKLSKGDRKLKKTKHCIIPKTLKINEKKIASGMRTEFKVDSDQQKLHNGNYSNRCTKTSSGVLES